MMAKIGIHTHGCLTAVIHCSINSVMKSTVLSGMKKQLYLNVRLLMYVLILLPT